MARREWIPKIFIGCSHGDWEMGPMWAEGEVDSRASLRFLLG